MVFENGHSLRKREHLQRVVKRQGGGPGPVDVPGGIRPATSTPSAAQTSPAQTSPPVATSKAPDTTSTQAADTTAPVVNRPPITNPPDESLTGTSSNTSSNSSRTSSASSSTPSNSSSSSGSQSSNTAATTVPAQQTTANADTAVGARTSAMQTATFTRSVAGTSTISAAASTSSSADSSGVSTAGIVGIAAAGIVGAAVLAGIVMFFIRRWNRRNSDEFDPVDFKRHSVVLQDDDMSSFAGHGGGRGPRPPTMIERHKQALAMPPPAQHSFQTGYGYSGGYGAAANYNDFGPAQPPVSFAPGQIVPTGSPAPSTNSYGNAAPFFNPSFKAPQSATGAPVGSAMYANVPPGSGLVRAPSAAATSMLPRGNPTMRIANPENDYVDLSRASVTPYQAAQYAAISKQLNIPPPVPLPHLSEVSEQHTNFNTPEVSKPSMDLISPFENTAHADEKVQEIKPSRPSSEFHSVAPYERPSDRSLSPPPSLPEIHMASRVFSSVDFPVTPSPCAATFASAGSIGESAPSINTGSGEPSPLGRSSPHIAEHMPPLSPVASSPQRATVVNASSSFQHNGRETPVEIGFVRDNGNNTPAPAYQESNGPAAAAARAPEKSAVVSAPTRRPDTLYDDEDAYGGF